MKLSGWGNYPSVECDTCDLHNSEDAVKKIENLQSGIARGNGRAYGDAALGTSTVILAQRLKHILSFDKKTGLLTCESGLLLSELLDIFIPKGWFPPVTPGTKLVSIGGMIAADVHGKNHHISGSFCDHLHSLTVLLANGEIVWCSRSCNPDLFSATCGGMGLTGVILTATFSLLPIETAWIRQETIKCKNLQEIITAFEDSQKWTYSVAWIDCLSTNNGQGRSLLFRGEHASLEELSAKQRQKPLSCKMRRKTSVPFKFPNFILNQYTVRVFNEIYYCIGGAGESIIDYDTFFYPLDSVNNWNRIYGSRGFTQFQCVLPLSASFDGLKQLLETVSHAGMGSFLAVLKLLGNSKSGDLSFPMEGYTLALDIPIRRKTFALMQDLEKIVQDYGGRLYLAKDVMMQPETMAAGYPNLGRFLDVRNRVDSNKKFQSLQSQRLGI